ncbi:MAG: phenylacetate--CoA ligase family protein, partial [Deltaproteobacteria bacterium]|nr:phenylacetate--CoA ligase family protein [Deltaproteobacteria bacterium]
MIERARASGRWDLDKLTRWQEARLRSLLRHAYDNVPMYGRLFREAGFEPGMFRSLNDLKLIPVLSKSRLLEAEPHEVIARGIAPADCQVVRTSGSTGTPLMVYLGAREVCWHRAVAWRILFEHGFRWTDRTLEIRMTSGPVYALQRFGIAPKDWMSILESPASWARCLARRRHEVVVACSSSLHALAEAVESRGVEVRSPRLIISD